MENQRNEVSKVERVKQAIKDKSKLYFEWLRANMKCILIICVMFLIGVGIGYLVCNGDSNIEDSRFMTNMMIENTNNTKLMCLEIYNKQLDVIESDIKLYNFNDVDKLAIDNTLQNLYTNMSESISNLAFTERYLSKIGLQYYNDDNSIISERTASQIIELMKYVEHVNDINDFMFWGALISAKSNVIKYHIEKVLAPTLSTDEFKSASSKCLGYVDRINGTYMKMLDAVSQTKFKFPDVSKSFTKDEKSHSKEIREMCKKLKQQIYNVQYLSGVMFSSYTRSLPRETFRL